MSVRVQSSSTSATATWSAIAEGEIQVGEAVAGVHGERAHRQLRQPRAHRPRRAVAGARGEHPLLDGEHARLEGLLDLAGLQALRADVCTSRPSVEDDADALEVGIEASLRGHHRVAPVVTEGRLLPADGADLGHGRGIVASAVAPRLAAASLAMPRFRTAALCAVVRLPSPTRALPSVRATRPPTA